MATTASTSMAATAVFMPCRLPTSAVTPRCSALPNLPPPRVSTTPSFSASLKQISVKASSSEESSPPVDAGEIFSDLKEKWDAVENKSTVILYGGGAIVAVWLSSIIVGAINSVPLVASKDPGVGRTWIYRMVCLSISSVQEALVVNETVGGFVRVFFRRYRTPNPSPSSICHRRSINLFLEEKMMRVIDVRRLKPSSVEFLTHQLIQKCSVSGTAKGKSKLKTAAPLKRSKVTTKKGKSPEDASEKGEGRRFNQFEEMVDNCLNATSPVRHLKPKEREREAEREKMGLMSKTRAKEIETMKKKKSESDTGAGVVMGPPGLDLITLGLVDADKLMKYELTVEDGRRLAKEYSRVLMRRHRARQAAESNLLRLKKEAIEALPEGLKEAALVPDLTPFPVNRFMATLTPPIEGYIEKVNEAAKKSTGKEKLRR
ncbi:hypothetical protein C3L33_07903, partial [Rhododendron williamsianum]